MIKRQTLTLTSLLAIGIAGVGAANAATQNKVPAEFQGRWVPTKMACASSVAVMVAGDKLTLVNGNDRQSLGGIEMAGPGYFAPDYNGIMAVLITEFTGQQPVTATFNLREKKGVAQVDFAPVLPGAPTALSQAYSARINSLKLATRFPLNAVPLKKCPGAAGAAK
jgi:hypothetical protein